MVKTVYYFEFYLCVYIFLLVLYTRICVNVYLSKKKTT